MTELYVRDWDKFRELARVGVSALMVEQCD